MKKTALIIGNSSGIGLEISKRLLDQGLKVIGLSKSPSSISDSNYQHILLDVIDDQFENLLTQIVTPIDRIDIGIYCAGIGEKIDLTNLAFETKVFKVNLMSAVVATNVLLTKMMQQGAGHFIGLSSIVDNMTSGVTPSYCASKAGVSRYWESLGLAYQKQDIHVSNIRFGFVDTKMAKAPTKPMMIDVKTAAKFIEEVIENPRIRATKPRAMAALTKVIGTLSRLRLLGH